MVFLPNLSGLHYNICIRVLQKLPRKFQFSTDKIWSSRVLSPPVISAVASWHCCSNFLAVGCAHKWKCHGLPGEWVRVVPSKVVCICFQHPKIFTKILLWTVLFHPALNPGSQKLHWDNRPLNFLKFLFYFQFICVMIRHQTADLLIRFN